MGFSLRGTQARTHGEHLIVYRIEIDDLRDVLSKGLADFGSYRTDVVFLCIIYPLIGIGAWFVGRDLRRGTFGNE